MLYIVGLAIGSHEGEMRPKDNVIPFIMRVPPQTVNDQDEHKQSWLVLYVISSSETWSGLTDKQSDDNVVRTV